MEVFPVLRLNFNGEGADNEDFRNYYDEKRLIRLGAEFETDWGLEVNLNLDLTQGILANKANPLFSNIPYMWGVPLHGFIDTEPSFEAYIGYRNRVLDLSLGRRRWGMGAGLHSLTAGRQAPWFDGLWFNLHPDIHGYRFDWTILAAADDPGFIVKWNNGSSETAHSSAYFDGSDPLLDSWDSRWFLLHKTALRGDSWKAGVAETAIVVGNLDLYSGNPMSIWHSGFLGHVNVGIELSFETRIKDAWRVYGEIFFDDLPLEGGVTNPIAGAATVGADWQVFAGEERYGGPLQNPVFNAKLEDNLRFEGGLVLGLQLVYASRYVYSRSYDEAIERFTLYKHTIVGDFRNYEHYTGFDYGPDTALLSIQGTWQNSRFLVSGSLDLLLRGEFGVSDQQAADSWYWGGFHKEEGGAADWFFSERIAGFEAVIDIEGWYAINGQLSGYGKIRSRLSTVPGRDNRFLLEGGVLYKL